MKSQTRKVGAAFRLPPELLQKLKDRSEVTKISQGRIVEDALEIYLNDGSIKKAPSNLPTITFRPSDGAKKNLSEWDKTSNDRAIFLNYLLSKYGEQALKELPPLLAQIGMV